ncbi:protein suppressor of white apricot isoform X2 [Harmonia axyridis]|uniref:protein suppressor of white apricot isoform X2 n=1 Tax=Harmonia axyridis TaxID=115357 RepID=UPI001E279823|nr:protein suppressor of white apricot isoform X2 [Harmonia axyridis]
MAYWNSSESGILRKKKKDDDLEKLLIFGYACKLFRDDEKALHIDQGKHLIPWMGNESLKIDRYDCRGHLSDLSRYEASREDYDTTRWLGLDEHERKLEQLCDEERYYSLLNNEDDEDMYKEEELKRSHTNEYQYNYDVPTNPDEKEVISTVSENDIDEKYVPSPDLDVPVDIAIPKTMKEYTRIEKTAIFVSTQGPQMEILIKAKQSDNPQFSFLNQNDPLFKFYRHVLDIVKNRRFRANVAKSDFNVSSSPTNENSDHYLHPSLVSSATPSTMVQPTIPSIPYRPNANCAYSQLVSRIQGTTKTGSTVQPSKNSAASEDQGIQNMHLEDGVQLDVTNLTYDQQQQYYQYYMQRHYYEYYKHLLEKGSSDPSSNPESVDPNIQAFIQQMMYSQYIQQSQAQEPQQQSSNPYAQIVSNLCKEMPHPPNLKTDISKDPIIYSERKEPVSIFSANETKISNGENSNENACNLGDSLRDDSPKKAALSLIQNYASDSEEEVSDSEQELRNFKIPDEETKVVIDKMAGYVVKNGGDFEKIVKSRQDPRFIFLKEDHEFHQYYRHKVEEEHIKLREKVKPNEEAEIKDLLKYNAGKIREKKIIAPVSFSIKKPKEEPPKEIKSALPVDEETDEEEINKEETIPLAPVNPQPPTLISSNTTKKPYRIDTSLISREKENESKSNVCTLSNRSENKFEKLEQNKSGKTETQDKDQKSVTEKCVIKEEEKSIVHSKTENASEKDDPILEMIDLTEDEKNIDSIRNADIFDLNPEKKGAIRENRALQLERKRKALAFLKLKSAFNDIDHLPDGGKTIPTIDLSNIQSPKKKYISSEGSDDDKKIRFRKSRSKTRNYSHSKSFKDSEKSLSRKDREKHRKIRAPRLDKDYDSEESEKEDGEMSDETNDSRSRKSSHKKKKSHKRKRAKSKHSSKTKKKFKKDMKTVPSSSSDSEQSIHS